MRSPKTRRKRGLMKATLRAMLLCVMGSAAMIAASTVAFQKRFALPAPPTKTEIERGRYLVEEIAKCAECHTPRKADGELDGSAWLRGAPIWIRPVAPIPNWAGPCSGPGGLTKLYAGASREGAGKRNGAEWRTVCGRRCTSITWRRRTRGRLWLT